MSSDRWRLIEQLCHEALARDARGRAAFLDEACGDDAELRREVESLLAQQSAARDFMETPIPAGQRFRVAIGAQPWTGSARTGYPTDLSGRTVSHYAILEKVGEGGMGVIYKARDTHLDRLVALKVLPPETVADPERKRRFVQEAKAASALNHPNIVTVHDIDTADGVTFIVMEYVQGTALDRLIEGKGLVPREALKHAAQIKAPASGGSPVAVAPNGWGAVESSDGRFVYYSGADGRFAYYSGARASIWRDGGTEEGVWRASTSGGSPVRLARNGWGPVESFDGKFVYYNGAERSIWRVAAGGGEPTWVLKTGPRALWTLTSAGIDILNPDATGGPGVGHFSFSGELRALVPLPGNPDSYLPYPSGMSASPDGRWILYMRVDRAEPDVMLVDNFR